MKKAEKVEKKELKADNGRDRGRRQGSGQGREARVLTTPASDHPAV